MNIRPDEFTKDFVVKDQLTSGISMPDNYLTDEQKEALYEFEFQMKELNRENN
jgi:hypothetical protein